MPFATKCTVEIDVVDRKPLYTNGDVIEGTVRVTVHEEIDIEAIDIKLRCNEVARVRYSTGQTTAIDERKIKRLNECERLFPTYELQASRAKSHQIRRGTHKFIFRFVIPHGPEAALGTFNTNSCNSRVEWYLKVTMRRPEVLKRNVRQVDDIFFQPLHLIPDNVLNAVSQDRYIFPFRAHLPGCKRGLSRMFGDSDHRKETSIKIVPCYSLAGIAQSPRPIGLRLLLECSDPELVLVRDVTVTLKAVTWINANHHTSRAKFNVVLFSVAGAILNLSNPKDMLSLDQRLADVKLEHVLPPNFTSECFNLSYTLAIDIVFASEHLHDHKRKHSLKFPVRVQSSSITLPQAARRPQFAPAEEPLPLYNETEAPPFEQGVPKKTLQPIS